MTERPKKPCRNPMCSGLTINPNGYCDNCQTKVKQREKAVRQEYNTRRDPQTAKWTNSARYKRARLHFMSHNPFCKHCSTSTRPVVSIILDHIIPHKGDASLFWDVSNWQMLCKKCHDKKTAREDGGFGNRVANREKVGSFWI